MKTILFATATVLFSTIAMAGIKRVNNNAGVDADFTAIQAAHDASAAGDTIYVEGSTISYGNLTINKKIYLIGPGYFLPQNPQTQANPSSAPFGTITCGNGSSGSFITGVDASFISIQDNNIVIKRNYIHVSYGVDISSNKSNILIVQNYISGGTSSNSINLNAGCSNIIISNNFVDNTYGGAGAFQSLNMNTSASAVITNNIFKSSITINNSTFDNNILVNTNATVTQANSLIENSLCAATQFPATNGNQLNINMTNVFVGATGNSTDGQWKLSPTSPAIAAGLNGEDCGIYGGNDRYVLSGLPAVPSIFYFSAPSSGSGTLPVHVKIKSNK